MINRYRNTLAATTLDNSSANPEIMRISWTSLLSCMVAYPPYGWAIAA
ncbi:MAG: hypothetical protein WBB82_14340 [Limnothrix sp.]